MFDGSNCENLTTKTLSDVHFPPIKASLTIPDLLLTLTRAISVIYGDPWHQGPIFIIATSKDSFRMPLASTHHAQSDHDETDH